MNYLKDSVSPVPSAKYYYRTKEFNDINVNELFEQFINTIYSKVNLIKTEIENNNGKLNICIVFTNFVEKPCLYMSNNTLTQLSELGASYDIDFI